jgi:hypothetical protein
MMTDEQVDLVFRAFEHMADGLYEACKDTTREEPIHKHIALMYHAIGELLNTKRGAGQMGGGG